MLPHTITTLNTNLITSLVNLPVGLAQGKMGACIYFYTVGQQEQSSLYSETADKLLDEVYSSINLSDPIDLKNGLLGIALGVKYLLEKKYIAGDKNMVLQEIDDEIFKRLSYPVFEKTIEPGTYLCILYYLILRIEDFPVASEPNRLYKDLLIRVFNTFYSGVGAVFFEEPLFYTVEYKLPLFLFVLSRLYRLNIYNYRIEKVLEEIGFNVLSKMPRLHSNRLYLLWAVQHIYRETGFIPWKDHMELLGRELDIAQILDSECKKKNLFFWDGLTSIYWWLTDLQNLWGNTKTEFYKKQVLDHIHSSHMWDLLLEEPLHFTNCRGLYRGFCGTVLLLNSIKNE